MYHIDKKVAVTVVIILIFVIGIHILNGRNFICTCGYIKLFNGQVNVDDSQHLTDWYTLSHIIHGFLFYFLTYLLSKWKKIPLAIRFIIALLLESTWEILENSSFVINHYQSTTVSTMYHGDSIINSLSDIGAMGFGFYLASKLPTWVIVILALILEALAAYVIHDNLTLNAFMFIYPMKSIVEWQQTL